MDEYRNIEEYLNKKKNNNFNNRGMNSSMTFAKVFVSKILISFILFLSFLIGAKVNDKFKKNVYKEVYDNTISFATITKWYNSKFGSIFPIDIVPGEERVFSEKLIYSKSSAYKDGVSLEVNANYLVPLLENGVVIFIGDKTDYGNTVIVQGENGVDIWYCNINVGDIKLYDHLTKGSFVGEAKDKHIYLVFKEDGKYVDYKDFI